jgi:tetratricopeptide (TPR) repeat protein
MNYLKYIVTIIIFSQLLSCTKSYTYNFNDIEKHVVVNSFFFPDSLMRFNITEEASLSDDITLNGYNIINNAQIVIYENDNVIDTALYTEKGNYYSDIKPKLNAKYKISVIAPKYDKVIAEDQIPKLINIDSLGKIKNSDESYNYKIKIIFDDPAEDDNYYFIYAYWGKYYNDLIYFKEAYIRTQDPAIGEWLTQSFQAPIFNDELFNGKRYELTVDLSVNTYTDQPGYCYFELRSISKNMYLYLKSYNKQTPKFGDDLMEMFQQGMIEPIPIYSNIDGGLGIFAGYAVSRDSVYFE